MNVFAAALHLKACQEAMSHERELTATASNTQSLTAAEVACARCRRAFVAPPSGGAARAAPPLDPSGPRWEGARTEWYPFSKSVVVISDECSFPASAAGPCVLKNLLVPNLGRHLPQAFLDSSFRPRDSTLRPRFKQFCRERLLWQGNGCISQQAHDRCVE